MGSKQRNWEKAGHIFENKILISVSINKRKWVWRIKHNKEIRALYGAPDLVDEAKSRRWRWAKHVMRRGADTLVKPSGHPKKRWDDEVDKDTRKMEVNEENAEDPKYNLGYQWPWE